MICYFVIHRRSVETKVIVGDCAWRVTLAV
jgi:hypothetical protein